MPSGTILTLVPSRLSHRERNKEKTRAALETVALRLFEERGYAQTSVDDIAAGAHVSRRTFFRYFGSKEGVIFTNAEDNGKAFQDAILDQPPEYDGLQAFAGAVVELSNLSEGDRLATLARQRIFQDNPQLRGRLAEVAEVWRRYLAAALAQREGRDAPNESDVLNASVGITVIQTVVDQWAIAGGTDSLGDRMRGAFDSLTERAPVSLL
jgi:AcrR family transcriptional regulator